LLDLLPWAVGTEGLYIGDTRAFSFEVTGTERLYIGDTQAFQFENISAEDVKLFLLKQMYKGYEKRHSVKKCDRRSDCYSAHIKRRGVI